MDQLDLEFYSRELFALGQEAMEKLSEFKVLITGLSPLGLQVARLLVLSGVKSLYLNDEAKVSPEDTELLSSGLTGEVTRSQAAQALLQGLNRRVTVTAVQGDVLGLNLKEYDLVVTTDINLTTLTHLSNMCREKSKHLGFIACEAWGATGTVFVDFNHEFLVYDKDGQEPESYLITNISQSCPGIVTIDDQRPLKLKDGDWVTFKGVKGMVEVTLPEPRPIRCQGPCSFSIEDTSAYSDYLSGGVVTQFKMPDMVNFLSFQKSLLEPHFDDGLSRPDVHKGDRIGQLHFAYHAVHEFRKKHGGLPTPAQANECYEIAVRLNQDAKDEKRYSVEAINREVACSTAAYSTWQFKPLIDVISGITALEVIKFTGRYMPIHQWFHYDCFDLLPSPP